MVYYLRPRKTITIISKPKPPISKKRSNKRQRETSKLTNTSNGKWILRNFRTLKNQDKIEEAYNKNISIYVTPYYVFHFQQHLIWQYKSHKFLQGLSWQCFTVSSKNNVQEFIQRNTSSYKQIIWAPDIQTKLHCFRSFQYNPNSQLLFHGTPTLTNAKNILKNGFNPKCRIRQHLGKGDYFTHVFEVAQRYGSYVIVAYVKNPIPKCDNQCFISRQAKNAYPLAILIC